MMEVAWSKARPFLGLSALCKLVDGDWSFDAGYMVTPIFWSKKSDLMKMVSFWRVVFAGKGRGYRKVAVT